MRAGWGIDFDFEWRHRKLSTPEIGNRRMIRCGISRSDIPGRSKILCAKILANTGGYIDDGKRAQRERNPNATTDRSKACAPAHCVAIRAWVRAVLVLACVASLATILPHLSRSIFWKRNRCLSL